MKNAQFILLIIIGCIINHALFADLDYIDRITAPIPGIPTDMNPIMIDKYSEWSSSKNRAMVNKDWAIALQFERKLYDSKMFWNGNSINKAGFYLEFSLLLWNNGQYEEAKAKMRLCVESLTQDRNININGYAQAVNFYNNMLKNALPSIFDFNNISNLQKLLLDEARKQWKAAVDRQYIYPY